MTRRTLVRLGFGLPIALKTPVRAFSKEFWNEEKPSTWKAAEVQELLTKSPWTREATVHDTAQVGFGGTGRAGDGGRRGGRTGQNTGGAAAPSAPDFGPWTAAVRWESALPIREALKKVEMPGAAEYYILNLLGNIPSPSLGPDESEQDRRCTLEILQDHTKLDHKGDTVGLSRVELSPRSDLSPAGTLFYFHRDLALQVSDKETTFATRVGPIEVKCKFILKDMLYRGNLEL